MTGNINELSKYNKRDIEKTRLITYTLEGYCGPRMLALKPLEDMPEKAKEFQKLNVSKPYYRKSGIQYPSNNECELEMLEDTIVVDKYCPECGRKYPKSENFCADCLVHLKNISDEVDVCQIKSNPKFPIRGDNDYDEFEDLLAKSNLSKINAFEFGYADYSEILHVIKLKAFKNFDTLIKTNGIDFDSLDILDKIILFTKSFVNVEYKSFGRELGYFEDNTIIIDDRQTKSLQITTLIHELSHFIIHEILIYIICKILDASRNSLIEVLATFILSYSSFTQLIDEYSAHSVEGRFTIFGYQDYSSYRQIEKNLQGEMSKTEIEITKSIGNTFSINIKDILESFIDKDLREEIKEQFMSDVVDEPDYNALRMENCQKLNDEGFLKAIWLILNEGCEVASSHIDELLELSS